METEKRQANAGAACLPCQPGLGHLLAIQASTGRLMLSRTSDCTLLEPIIIVFLGVVMSGLLVAMYLPIFKLGAVV